MLRGLRKRLAVIFTVFTGAILTAALGISLYLSFTQTVLNNDLWFSNTVDRVTSAMISDFIENKQTSINAGEYIVFIQIEGQPISGFSAPEDSSDSLSVKERQVLFEQVKAYAKEHGMSNWVTENSFTFAYNFANDSDEIGVHMGIANESVENYYTAGNMLIIDDAITIAATPILGTEGVFKTEFKGAQYRSTYFCWDMNAKAGESGSFYEVAVMHNLSGQTNQLMLDGLFYFAIWVAGIVLLFLANWFLAKLVLRPTEDGLRRQTEFVAAASHELRSPLAVIRSSLSAEDVAETPEQAEKFHTAAIDEAERMSRLVDDLLLLAGGDAGSWQLHSAPVDLDTLLIDLAEDYLPLAKKQKIKIQLDLPKKTLPKVSGDSHRLRQILAALMDNALQYAPANTNIILSAMIKKGKVSIHVADKGCGIPDEMKTRVFERFYQGDKSRHDKAHFGLGLSIAKELAELHGGQLTITDTEGGGATFTLTLPQL